MSRTSFEPDRRRRSRRYLAALPCMLLALAAPTPAHATTATFSYAGPAVPIPDAADLSGTAPGAPASATINVAGMPTVIADVNFRIDGTACSTTAGSTTVGIDHTFVNDLQVKLTSPAGTTVLLIQNTDGSGNNFCQTLLDDDAGAPSIQTAVTANAPFTGTWAPANPLSAFDGQNPNGNWTVSVQDFFAADTGNIRAVSLIIDARAATTLSTQASPGNLQGAPVRDVATIGGGASPTGTVTFKLFSDAGCGSQVFTSANAVSGTSATSDWFTPTSAGTYYWTASYSGDASNAPSSSACGAANESVTITAFAAPPQTQPTITGDYQGPLTVGAGQSVVISAARVIGPVTVNPGGALTVVNSSISGGLAVNNPTFFSLCGTSIAGASPAPALSVTNAAVPVRIGDVATGCAGNRFAGSVSVTGNLAVTFGSNMVAGNATLDGNGAGATVVKANNVFATLGCASNNPAPSNAGAPNTAATKTGQCTGL